MLEQIIANIDNRSIRLERLEGREYIVAPMVMITEGVHEGSHGPLLYTARELAQSETVWNHKPIVVYHPQINGQCVSACDPAVINTRKVGIILNARWDSARSKLRAEAWLERSRLTAVDVRVLSALERRQLMEVSTGLFTDTKSVSGEWNGKPYAAIATNYRPDHLALLPDRKGACSIEDGAGLLQLNEEQPMHLEYIYIDENDPLLLPTMNFGERDSSPRQNYAGSTVGRPIGNAGQARTDEEQPLELPKWHW